MRADRQTNRHTHHNTLQPSWSKLIICFSVKIRVWTVGIIFFKFAIQRLFTNGISYYMLVFVFATPLEAKYSDEHVCLFVCLSTHIYQESYISTSTNFLCMLPSCGHGLVLLWWHDCYISGSSGFMDDIMFFYNWPYGMLSQQPCCNVVHRLIPLLHGIIYVLS